MIGIKLFRSIYLREYIQTALYLDIILQKAVLLINQSRFTKIISRKTYLLQMCTFHTDNYHSSKSFTSGMELVSLDCLDRNLEKSSVLASGTNLKCVSSSSSSSDTWRDIAGETGADGGRGNRIS